MAYYYKSPLTALLEGVSSGLTTGLTQAGVDWWRSKLKEKELVRGLGMKGLLQGGLNAPLDVQEQIAQQAKEKYKLDIPSVTEPIYSAASGGGPITPLPDVPLNQLKQTGAKKKFLFPMPSLEEAKTKTWVEEMEPEERTRAMRGLESTGSLANLLNAENYRRRVEALYSPGGLEERKVATGERKAGIAEQELPIKQQHAQAATTSAGASQQRAGIDQDRLQQVELPEAQSRINYRTQTIEHEQKALAAKTANDRVENAIRMYVGSVGHYNAAINADKAARDRGMRPPQDLDAQLAEAEAAKNRAVKIMNDAVRGASATEQPDLLKRINDAIGRKQNAK
jgi:hypothetical protein